MTKGTLPRKEYQSKRSVDMSKYIVNNFWRMFERALEAEKKIREVAK